MRGLGERSWSPPRIPLYFRGATESPCKSLAGWSTLLHSDYCLVSGYTGSTNVTWLTFQVEKVKCYPYVSQISFWTSTFYKRKSWAVIALGILHPCQGSYSLSCPKTSANTATDNATDCEWKAGMKCSAYLKYALLKAWKRWNHSNKQTNKHHPSLGKKPRLPALVCVVFDKNYAPKATAPATEPASLLNPRLTMKLFVCHLRLNRNDISVAVQ